MQDFLLIKEGVKFFKVPVSELQYVESAQRYVRFVTATRTYLTEGPLMKVEKQLPRDQFCRIHRSVIVSFRYAHQLGNKVVVVAGKEFPVGRRYKGILWSRIAILYTNTKLLNKVVQESF